MASADDDNPSDKDKDHKDHDGLTEGIRQRLEHLVPELVKKTFAAGMGAVFSTEEGIRKLAREVSLPDAVGSVTGYIADSADGAKDKVFEVIARETREFLSNLNVGEELAKLLTTLSFEIKTEIRFIPNTERFVGAEPDVKASVRLKRADDKGDRGDAKDAKDTKDAKDAKDAKDDGEGRSRLRFWRRDDGGSSGGGSTGGANTNTAAHGAADADDADDALDK